MEPTRLLIAEVRLNPCTGQARGLAAEIQARMEGGQCAEKDAVFHVKRFFIQGG